MWQIITLSILQSGHFGGWIGAYLPIIHEIGHKQYVTIYKKSGCLIHPTISKSFLYLVLGAHIALLPMTFLLSKHPTSLKLLLPILGVHVSLAYRLSKVLAQTHQKQWANYVYHTLPCVCFLTVTQSFQRLIQGLRETCLLNPTRTLFRKRILKHKQVFMFSLKHLYQLTSPESSTNPCYIRRLVHVCELIDSLLANIHNLILMFCMKDVLVHAVIELVQEYADSYTRVKLKMKLLSAGLEFCFDELRSCEVCFYDVLKSLP